MTLSSSWLILIKLYRCVKCWVVYCCVIVACRHSEHSFISFCCRAYCSNKLSVPFYQIVEIRPALVSALSVVLRQIQRLFTSNLFPEPLLTQFLLGNIYFFVSIALFCSKTHSCIVFFIKSKDAPQGQIDQNNLNHYVTITTRVYHLLRFLLVQASPEIRPFRLLKDLWISARL